MKLNNLINCDYEIEITGIKTNSNQIKKGDLFICTDYGTTDRHLFIDDAIKNGASAIIVKKNIENKSIPIIKVDDPNKAFVDIINKFYDYPTKKLNMIGITGTDGKTTVATIIHKLIDNCAYIGTNGIIYNDYKEKSPNTTPALDKTYPLFVDMINKGIKTVSMEASSEGILFERIKGIEFNCSIITNITKEHMNHHHTLENYIDCKCELFRNTIGPCILNKDDEHYLEVAKNCKGKIYTYGSGTDNDLYFKDVDLYNDKTIFKIVYQNKEYIINSPMVALFNVYNLCASLLALVSIGYDINELINNIKNIKVSGRLENIDLGQDFKVIIDYAHTPNGINKLLEFANGINHNKLIVVFSEPGERDKSKRPDKGYNVITNCDHAIITSQDPRSENPMKIANDLLTKVKDYNNYEIILDRSEAIKKAIEMATKDDIVLIIGKGSENYQILKDKTIEFNDIEEAKKHINNKIKNI
ncbi:MAG: UDP-N-acetylmuramoyl-L-alanyl-D-glutamate--2,6-diaminopimelate ligase [Firmicutes bacterium]|nr:UDP-N-acetylmuramoyl-L-alanyl-D-glutamate--2,6-diaminopimelate ligase [Bacillota bacterium]